MKDPLKKVFKLSPQKSPKILEMGYNEERKQEEARSSAQDQVQSYRSGDQMLSEFKIEP